MIIGIRNLCPVDGADLPLLRQGIRAALKSFAPARRAGCEISVALVSDEEIAGIHGEYLDDPTPTDVITFPLAGDTDGEGASVLGEIVISAETALREARKRRKPVAEELLLYAIHGALHLAGYDDREPAEAAEMKQRQENILAEVVSRNSAAKDGSS